MRIHIVQRGETIEKIANKYGVSVHDVRKANHGLSMESIERGDKVKIPSYEVPVTRGEKKAPKEMPKMPVQETPKPKPLPKPAPISTPKAAPVLPKKDVEMKKDSEPAKKGSLLQQLLPKMKGKESSHVMPVPKSKGKLESSSHMKLGEPMLQKQEVQPSKAPAYFSPEILPLKEPQKQFLKKESSSIVEHMYEGAPAMFQQTGTIAPQVLPKATIPAPAPAPYGKMLGTQPAQPAQTMPPAAVAPPNMMPGSHYIMLPHDGHHSCALMPMAQPMHQPMHQPMPMNSMNYGGGYQQSGGLGYAHMESSHMAPMHHPMPMTGGGNQQGGLGYAHMESSHAQPGPQWTPTMQAYPGTTQQQQWLESSQPYPTGGGQPVYNSQGYPGYQGYQGYPGYQGYQGQQGMSTGQHHLESSSMMHMPSTQMYGEYPPPTGHNQGNRFQTYNFDQGRSDANEN
ncbi:spoVID-dependent spore coat assembly factor SafA [Fictibacillus macauensis ZFHKF-1]|uniref:SpoVID-dependent spore coat assembly factor SafA n=1 Tax=Fictibacillus macauensis ZFHKF-1 TaxID=1196324 RepID=I8UES3_9BACL|nr:LysM domain-containing protein [Fictibacillus macauensis]EIT85323.1 spoVID-dependent spore coat assembly factor SafA [Fictibacillus macauensis ZFHKF-1]